MDRRILIENMIMAVCRAGDSPAFLRAQEYSSGETGILVYLASKPEGTTAGSLRKRIHVGASRIANALRNLEDKGLVVRNSDPRDRRRVIVRITEKGLTLSRQKEKVLFDRINALVEAMGESNFTELTRLINTLFDTLEQAQHKIEESNTVEA